VVVARWGRMSSEYDWCSSSYYRKDYPGKSYARIDKRGKGFVWWAYLVTEDRTREAFQVSSGVEDSLEEAIQIVADFFDMVEEY